MLYKANWFFRGSRYPHPRLTINIGHVIWHGTWTIQLGRLCSTTINHHHLRRKLNSHSILSLLFFLVVLNRSNDLIQSIIILLSLSLSFRASLCLLFLSLNHHRILSLMPINIIGISFVRNRFCFIELPRWREREINSEKQWRVGGAE